MDRTSIVILFILGLLVIASFSGCLAKEESDRFMTEALGGEYETNQNTTLKVMNINGYTKVYTYEGDTVKLTAEKKVLEKFKSQLNLTHVQVIQESNEIIIETAYTDIAKQKVSVTLDIAVPEYVKVDFVQSSNGGISVKNVTGYPKVSTINGEVEVRGTSGISNVSSQNGDVIVEIHDFMEDIRINSSNGNVIVYILTTLNATIDLSTKNGVASITGVILEKDVEEKKHISGTLNDGGLRIDISTLNGDVELRKLVD